MSVTSAVGESKKHLLFEKVVMCHFHAAHSLARWLTQSSEDANDVVQEALLRAFTYFDNCDVLDRRAWLLSIVRNTFYTWFRKNRSKANVTNFDENVHSISQEATNPEVLHLQRIEWGKLSECIERLTVEFREVLVLRDIENLTYRQIADVTGLPIGTVMSRLYRARRRVRDCVKPSADN